ncbi:gp41 [Erannis ankeraria nucleopolyhedrovirus]|uniref:gp41 n=1 Tax=Erannis ankeraria nucleopolyhedrovirus TaxID=2913600 RepID=UPI00117AD712|nr:gp41 [Erannis ankeraria nucleopolyhedrovirus]UJZ89023.1 gp41 [Erannis ankeraria nucleopolyhedrovirus]
MQNNNYNSSQSSQSNGSERRNNESYLKQNYENYHRQFQQQNQQEPNNGGGQLQQQDYRRQSNNIGGHMNHHQFGNSNSAMNIGGNNDGSSNMWTKQCVDLEQIIRYFRTNDYSGFDNETKLLVNTIRDICIDTSPVDVNVVKRFESDENLMKHYERLVNEGGGVAVPNNIFVQSFVDTIIPSYAQKFYNKGNFTVSDSNKAEAARQLSSAIQYQIAQAVTTSMPIPLPFTQQLTHNYITLLLKQAQIPPNIQQAVQTRKYNQLNNINDLINIVIDNIFAGGNDYYYYVLNDKNRARVVSLKENISYLEPLSRTTNIFEYIAHEATKKGKQPGLFREAFNITSSTPTNATLANAQREETLQYRRSLTELAFQNEALRRFIFQQLSYKSKF